MGCSSSSLLSAADASRLISSVVVFQRIQDAINSLSMEGCFVYRCMCQSEIFPSVKRHFEGLGYIVSYAPAEEIATISWFPKE